jgi:hypothetical protein
LVLHTALVTGYSSGWACPSHAHYFVLNATK